jgi:hypothetical protein
MSVSLHSYYWTLSKHFGRTLWREAAKDLVTSVLLALFTGVGTWLFHAEDAWTATTVGLFSVAGWYAVVALWHLARSPWHLHQNHDSAANAPQEAHWKFGVFAVVVILAILGGAALFGSSVLSSSSSEPSFPLIKFPPPAAPNVTIHKVIIKTTGSGRLDRDMNDQQSNHLYKQLKQIAENKDAPGLANVTLVHAYPCDRESQHLFARLNKVFTDAQWKVTSSQGWPAPGLETAAQHEIPISMWIVTRNQYLQVGIWSELQQAGLESQERPEYRQYLPPDFKGVMLVIGYKDVPF